jgi:hypothetical protein
VWDGWDEDGEGRHRACERQEREERAAGEGVSRGEEDEEEGSGVVVMVGGSKGGTMLCLGAGAARHYSQRVQDIIAISETCGG